MLESSVMEMN